MGAGRSADRPTPTPSHKYPQASSWVGWIAFAAVSMLAIGAFHVIQGVAALADPDYYPAVGRGPATGMGLSAWGWVHIATGLVLIVAGLCVFAGQAWARALGVAVAVVSAVASFGFVGAYPILSLVVIGMDVVIILALTVHGSDIKP